MKMNRVNELVASMKSFGKEKYYRDEVFTEMLTLEREIAALTFNLDWNSTANLKIWDVERHLEQLNNECGNVANEELKYFMDGSKKLNNYIKTEISRRKGTGKVFKTLENINTPKLILENVELKNDDERVKLDAVIITSQMITIVEIKNTSKNVYINENGVYYRKDERCIQDCNIEDRMKLKEELLKKILYAREFDNVSVNSLVVFTNDMVEIENRCEKIMTCFTSQINSIIEKQHSDMCLTYNEMIKIYRTVRAATIKEEYFGALNVESYKADFATLLAILEEASAKKDPVEEEQIVVVSKDRWGWLRRLFNLKKAS